MADKGAGITITYDTGYFGTIRSLSWSGLSRPAVDTTTFATTGGMTFEPADLYDPGTLEVEILAAPGTSPTIIDLDAAETCTVTFSDAGTATWAASAWISDLSIEAGDVNERVLLSATLKFSGSITIVP